MERRKIKVAYIGGGSRGWAWILMKDLAKSSKICGEVALYDIDFEAAKDNEIIGNSIKENNPEASEWTYKAEKNIGDALTGANFVVVSILPGTFDEMRSDVHTPEKYGIYQPVGDTIGPGGVIRALRTIPMFEVIGNAIKQYCPKAWVINYTNPMAVCINTLYKVFPEIKAFGCCHEVFGTQTLLARAVEEILGEHSVTRNDIRVNIVGVNHFTWLTEASYKGTDLMPIYREYAEKHIKEPAKVSGDSNWVKSGLNSIDAVKFDLFLRYGHIAAAGDRHLSEFCPGNWYTKNPEMVKSWGFALASVDWRVEELETRLKKSEDLRSGKTKIELGHTGEEGVRQMEAILGMGDFVTNINQPNIGQISNLPLGTVVETNAALTSDSARPVMAGAVPDNIIGLIAPIAAVQNLTVEAGMKRDLNLAFEAFINDPHVQMLTLSDAKKLFNEMIDNTKKYLQDYKI